MLRIKCVLKFASYFNIFILLCCFRLDLTLCKKQECMWPLVVEGNTQGEMLMDPSEVAVIHERLAHLTSEEWVSVL